jgi:selenide, water dikinase
LQNIPSLSSDDLLVGYETADDAAAVKIHDDIALVQSLDFFMPIVDDPFVFGQIAAANAISDIYAMGAKPILALAILGFPVKKLPTHVAAKIMEGGVDICHKAGIPLAGGHSIDDAEPKFGLSVTGTVHPQKIWKNATAQIGDVIILTKPLGVGVLGQGNKKGILSPSQYDAFVHTTTFLNKAAALAGLDVGIHSCTDVTGFGLVGHALEMAKGSGLHIELQVSALPILDGVWSLLQQGIKPGATSRNLSFTSADIDYAPHITDIQKHLCSDPQTSGGLLFSISKDKASQFIRSSKEKGTICAEVIGEVKEKKLGMKYISVR